MFPVLAAREGQVWKKKGVATFETVFKLMRAELTELQDVSARGVPVSKGVCPQQAVGASLENMAFVVWQVFFKSTQSDYYTMLFFIPLNHAKDLSCFICASLVWCSLTAKCGGESWHCCIYLAEDTPITEKQEIKHCLKRWTLFLK